MEPETNKNKPLSKEETKGLLSLIEGSKIINNRKTNATNNKMKVEEWMRIADAFNASIGTSRRTPQQLRLKWENLKKNSRKRNTLLRMERIKTGGGPPGYFHPDEILDRVASLLGSTGEGLTVLFGGDAEVQSVSDGGGGGVGVVEVKSVTDGGGSGVGNEPDGLPVYCISPPPMLLSDSPLPVVISNSPYSHNKVNENMTPSDSALSTNDIGDVVQVDKYTGTPMVNQKRLPRSIGIKRKLIKTDDGRQVRNEAMAEYFRTKTRLLEVNTSKQLLELENIKLENIRLKLEIKKLKGENIE